MARFVFKLESVLQHRRRLERQAQVALAERAAAVRALHDQLQELNAGLVRSNNELRENHLVGRVDVSYLSAHRRFTHDVTDRGAHLLQRIALAQKGMDEARTLLAEAARQRKVMETLREKHESHWRQEQKRREAGDENEAAGRVAFEQFAEMASTATAGEAAR